MPAPRQEVVTSRVVRATAVAEGVKRLHDYHCQVCGDRLETPSGPYAEGAHIHPLGSPHDGPDEQANVLCLFPNHHVLFDALAFSIRDDLRLVGRRGRLRTVPGHDIDPRHLEHHRRRFEEVH